MLYHILGLENMKYCLGQIQNIPNIVKTLTSSTQHFCVVGKLENLDKLMPYFVNVFATGWKWSNLLNFLWLV